MFRWMLLSIVLVLACLGGSDFVREASAQELDFQQRYVRGKLLYERKLYTDAVSELKKASYTARGRTHFGVHYYMALAYFWQPDIQSAHKALKIAKRLVKRDSHKSAIKRLYARIEQLYGKVSFAPEVDPDEVGRLRFSLKPKSAFSNKHKQRYFRILNARLKKNGVIPNSRTFYVPKGDYEVDIAKPQCLKYSLYLNDQKSTEISVGDSSLQIQLKAGRSCTCTGGQKIYKSGKKLYCACPSGTGWNSNKNRCEVGVNPVPWIIAGVGVVVVAAGAVVIGLVVAQNDGTDFRLLQNPGASTGDKTKVWK